MSVTTVRLQPDVEEGLEVIAEALFTGMLLGWVAPARAQVHSP